MLRTPAWQSLLPPARCALIELLNLYNGSNNGRIAMSARGLAERLHISRATAARALNDLSERGFIEVVRRGGFSCKRKLASEWRLTMYHCDVTSQIPSKTFTRWENGKIHFTASLRSHHGLTTEPINAPTK
jgi:hypothetical protein